MNKIYLQIFLLLGISLVHCVERCDDPEWMSGGFLSDLCYECKDISEIEEWCSRQSSGESVEPLACCNADSDDDYDEPIDNEDSSDFDDEYDDFVPESYDEYEDLDDFSDSDEFSDFEISDDDESDDEAFPGSELNDDEQAGPITNENGDMQMPDLGSLDYDDTIISNPPSPIDFVAPSNCIMAEILGNNYIDRLDEARQQCVTDLKEKLSAEFYSYMDQISETKLNFETFLEEHSDEISEDEQGEMRSQMSDYDQQIAQRSQDMRAQLLNPNCSEYESAVREEALLRAKDEYEKLEEVDADTASDTLLCLEDYLRSLRTSVEECESQMTSLFQQLLEPESTDIFYDKMCRKQDLHLVKEIVNQFFKEIDYESSYPVPVVEPEPDNDEERTSDDEIESRRVEISEELEQLGQELNQANSERDLINQKLQDVSQWRVRVENQLAQLGGPDSEEGQKLSALVKELLEKENALKMELKETHEMLDEIQDEMQTLLAEEIRLEKQLGILPDQPTEEPTKVEVDEFMNHLGPGPVIPDHDIDDDQEQYRNIEKESHRKEEGNRDDLYDAEPEERGHKGHVRKYAIGIMLFILVLLGILGLAICIPVVVIMSKKNNKKVAYDKASLAEKDPAILLKQTGFENPIYKFYSENSSKEDN